MKKFLFSLMAIVLVSISSFANDTNIITDCEKLEILQFEQDETYTNHIEYLTADFCFAVDRPWWQTAIIDAGGALGGGAAVAQFTGPPATPLQWAAIGVGAIVGGAASSLAANRVMPPGNGNNLNIPEFEFNNFNYVGQKHNLIVYDYMSKYSTFNSENYYNFIQENSEKYGIENKYLDVEYFNKVQEEVNAIYTIDDLKVFVLSKLPKDVSKEDISKLIEDISKSKNRSSALKTVVELEKVFNQKNIDKTSLNYMNMFFSTLKNSLNIW